MEFRVNPFDGPEIKDARERANLTQVELAAALGVSPRTVQGWETTNGTIPRALHRRRIVEFFAKLEKTTKETVAA